MIPPVMEEDNDSFGERQVFQKLLEQLPNEYVVFHSVRWNDRNEKNTVVWGESDFTIFHPEKGIIVIEVKSGGIECADNAWSYIRSDNNQKYKMKNPLKQAGRSKYRFIDIVEGIFENRPDYLPPQYCMVEAAVWFPSISSRNIVGELPMEFKPEIVLYETALDNPQKYIDGIYDFYEGKRHTKLNEESCSKVIEAFAPHYSVVASLKSKRMERNELFVRLTREQNSLLDYLEEQRVAAIQGAAGTGKTMLAVEKAKRLAANGKVLFLCFNRFLKDYLESLKNEDKKAYENIVFYNLPKLVCDKIGVPIVEKEDILQFLDRYENYDWNFKHVVIDEGQDFDEDEINKLYDIALLQDGVFYIFYDKNQFVQGREFPQWLLKAECRLILNINCRNTFRIADTSGKAIAIEPKVKNKAVQGDMPQFFVCATQKDAHKKLSVLIDQYRSNGFEYNQICIITVKTEENSILTNVNQLGNHRVSTSRENNTVLFTTARKFKGLESDTIIMIDIDEETFKDEGNRRLFYVGASRAKHELDIVFVGNDGKLEETVAAFNSVRYPNAVIGIAKCLNVKPILN